MKRIYFTLALIAIVFSLKAQVTITGADMPQPGKTYYMYFDTVPSISIGTASTSPQTWNFISAQQDYMKVAHYSSTAPYQAYAPAFAGSNMYTYGPSWMFAGFSGAAPIYQSDWGYLYWQSDNTGFKIVGFRSDYGLGDRNVLNTPKEVLMVAPASLGTTTGFQNSSWTTAYNVVPTNQDTNYVSRVRKNITADAFGTLTTGYGTFQVLRVHEELIVTDSVWASINGNPIPMTGFVVSRRHLHNFHFWANGVGYPVASAHCDSNMVVRELEYIDTVLPNYEITGQVLLSNGTSPATNCEVSLIEKNPWSHLFGVPEKVPVNSNGNFQFAAVLGDDWLVLANPDTITHPYTTPTYYGDTSYWYDADSIHVVSDTAITITLISENTANYAGSGAIAGTVFVDTTGSKSNMEPGEATVILEIDSTGEISRVTKTDYLGNYHFNRVPNRRYKMMIEKAGLYMDTTIYVQVNNDNHADIDFYYDTTAVYPINSSNVPLYFNGKSNATVYPNPFTDRATVSLKKDKEFQYTFSILDLSGRALITETGISEGIIQINRGNLKQGIYCLKLLIGTNEVYTGKFIVK